MAKGIEREQNIFLNVYHSICMDVNGDTEINKMASKSIDTFFHRFPLKPLIKPLCKYIQPL